MLAIETAHTEGPPLYIEDDSERPKEATGD